MAARRTGESAKAAQPGQMLLVIHEFNARSADELSLKKGDRLELIERDDDFGDGWYLGRQEQTGSTGLFPEVYTRPAPKSSFDTSTTKRTGVAVPSGGIDRTASNHRSAPTTPATATFFNSSTKSDHHTSGTAEEERDLKSEFASPGLLTSQTFPMAPSKSQDAPRSLNQTGTNVMNETLNVINEHITNMRRPSSGSGHLKSGRAANDSASDYSTHTESRTSYNQGQKTDDEEALLTEKEVSSWGPDKVAAHLEDVGVEKSHCDIFREQDISGDVLLSLDQSSMFLKEFELGSVGRRMRTWQKIKAVQEETRGITSVSTPKMTTSVSSSATSEKPPMNGSMLPRMSALISDSGSGRVDELGHKMYSLVSRPNGQRPPLASVNSSGSGQGSPRPSAASIRSLGHARRHSSMDMVSNPEASLPSHTKQRSLDQWPQSPVQQTPRAPSSHMYSMSSDRHQFSKPHRDSLRVITPSDPDRGYSSSGELEYNRRSKNILTKRSPQSAEYGHQRHSSHGSEKKRFSGPFLRNSKIESPSPTSEDIPAQPKRESTASKLYHMTKRQSLRAFSAPSMEKLPDTEGDPEAPTVTRLDYNDNDSSSPTVLASEAHSSARGSQTQASSVDDTEFTSPHSTRSFANRKSLRIISDAVTGHEKSSVVTSPLEYSPKNPAKPSTSFSNSTPPRSSTPSAASKSIESEQQGIQPPTHAISVAPSPYTGGGRTKTKHQTSAYVRGLQKISPQEQMIGCDYSGWMKKKSSNLITTWKPRLFILRGRRLSYYYSENDTEEKGLIDISSHRVLPADNERLHNFHASITGANKSPSSPPTATFSSSSGPPTSGPSPTSVFYPSPQSVGSVGNTPTVAGSSTAGPQGMFIFKLVPPRSGLSRAVNFTKPTVHYFAVTDLAEGRKWMAALMKSTIDRDESKEVVTTYQHKTISLERARARRELPPFLGGLDEESGRSSAGGERERDDGGDGSRQSYEGVDLNGEGGVPMRADLDENSLESSVDKYSIDTNGGASHDAAGAEDDPEPGSVARNGEDDSVPKSQGLGIKGLGAMAGREASGENALIGDDAERQAMERRDTEALVAPTF